MEKYNCQNICEIGVNDGSNFNFMIKHLPKIAVAVDCWINDGIASRNEGYSDNKLNRIYNSFKAKVANKPYVQIYRKYSFDAVKHFPDEYFDLIYIDADHTYEACLKDIEDWYPKLKRERIMIGDDYCDLISPRGVKFGVIKAVKQFAKANNLPFYVLPYYDWALIKP